MWNQGLPAQYVLLTRPQAAHAVSIARIKHGWRAAASTQ